MANNGNLTKTTYANGDYINYLYDTYGNISKASSETGTLATFIYNKKGLVAKSIDNASSETTYYYYDSNNNLVGLNLGGSTLFFYYDSDGNVTSFSNNDTMYYYFKNIQGDIVKIIMVKSKNKIKSKVNKNIQLEIECFILKTIKYNKKSYVFWAWNGDYINLGAGAELGIYTGGEYHWTVNKSLALPMSMNLKYNGNKIIS